MSLERRRLIAVVGLVAEARILAGPGVTTIISGGRIDGLWRRLEEAMDDDVAGVLSFGLCGALGPTLRPGDLIIGSAALSDGRRLAADLAWSARLADALPYAQLGVIAGVNEFVVGPSQKAALRAATGALAVDTKSHISARFAERFALPFAAVRAVSDGARRALPLAVQVGLRADGHTDIGAVLASLRANPSQLPAVVRVAMEARAGLQALKRCAAAARSSPG